MALCERFLFHIETFFKMIHFGYHLLLCFLKVKLIKLRAFFNDEEKMVPLINLSLSTLEFFGELVLIIMVKKSFDQRHLIFLLLKL